MPRLLSLLFACLLSLSAAANDLRLAVASNFRPALEALLPGFEQQHRVRVALSSGASGQLVAQIRQGAPFDILLSADSHYPEHLHQLGLAGAPRSYALGRLWLVTQQAADNWQQVLARSQRLALANPELAPYGAAARELLRQQDLWPAPEQKTYALAANIAQVQQWFHTGQVDSAFVAASLAGQPAHFFDLTPLLKQPLTQQLVQLNTARNNQAAQVFIDWLLSAPVQAQLPALGYLPAERL